MANSRYEYVKNFEVWDEIRANDLIVVRVDGRHFKRFSEVHGFEKPNDERGLRLMNACAIGVMDKYPDVVCSYGYSDEYSFVFKKTTEFYERRESKILSLIISYFTSLYVRKWKEFFSQDLCYPPSFHGLVVCCPTIVVLEAYLAWRQNDCHTNNLFNTCLSMLVKSGVTEAEAQDRLKKTQKQEKNELLFQQFGVNYKTIPEIFRQGSFIVKNRAKAVVKYTKDGKPVGRFRTKVEVVHSENIAAHIFLKSYATLYSALVSIKKDAGMIKCESNDELGCCKEDADAIKCDLTDESSSRDEDVSIIKRESMESLQFENKLMPSTWIVVRIDGCHFHRFSHDHKFEKPNDEPALNLMNACAVAVLKEFPDIIFAYGVSDEYSFVLSIDSQMYGRLSRKIVSSIVSVFSANYIMMWQDFFHDKELKYPPSFDGRAVCYPSSRILRDYLTWRQVDCHINNQYNTCFWMLVKSGKSESEAQTALKGSQTKEKNDLLRNQFGIEYASLPAIFRLGSSVFQDEGRSPFNFGASVRNSSRKVVVNYCNIIDDKFWEAHPYILGNDPWLRKWAGLGKLVTGFFIGMAVAWAWRPRSNNAK